MSALWGTPLRNSRAPDEVCKRHLAALTGSRLCCVQTVPSCQTLYKNSFTYHTVSTSPPEFLECFDFLGERLPLLGHSPAWALLHCD